MANFVPPLRGSLLTHRAPTVSPALFMSDAKGIFFVVGMAFCVWWTIFRPSGWLPGRGGEHARRIQSMLRHGWFSEIADSRRAACLGAAERAQRLLKQSLKRPAAGQVHQDAAR